jgi:hypothetical protein
VRDDAKEPELNPDKEAELREIAGRFGIGGEQDIQSDASVQIMEGGKPWKVEAEAAIAQGDTVIFAGSSHRKIGDDERQYMHEKYGVDADTELEMIVAIAKKQEGFVPLEENEILPFGYDIHNNFSLIAEQTGQLIKVGELNGKPVLVLRVDREDFTDEEGQKKYRNQPNSADLMVFVSDAMSTAGDDESSIGIVSSNTYASRAVDTLIAGLKANRTFSVGMYGRQTLAGVRGQEVADPSPFNQLEGELHVMHQKLANLRAARNSKSE